MEIPQDEWEEVDTSAPSTNGTGQTNFARPGGTKCSGCGVITEYSEMLNQGRKWFCNAYCVPRRHALGLM